MGQRSETQNYTSAQLEKFEEFGSRVVSIFFLVNSKVKMQLSNTMLIPCLHLQKEFMQITVIQDFLIQEK